MPFEPIEAEFARPPILAVAQEDDLRTLEVENLDDTLSGHSTPLTVVNATHGALLHKAHAIQELARQHTNEGYHIVNFEKGTGEDPREWSYGKKWYVTATTASLCLAVALGSSLVTGDIEGPTNEFGDRQIITNLTVTCFVMGFGIGPLFMAPLSEVLGRRPVYTASMFLYFIFTLPSCLAKNAATLVVGRMLAGLSASAPMCNVGGSIADVWAIEERGVPMAIFSVTLFIGPCLGPMLGGWIGQFAGWRWIYWVLFMLLGVCFCLTLFIPETLAPVILRKKARKLRRETGDNRYRTLEELEKVPISETIQIALVRPFVLLFQEVIVILFSIYLTFIYSLLYLMFFAFPIAFQEVRGFGLGITGTTFVSILLGIASALVFLPFQERLYARATKNGTFPEARLYPMMVGAVILPIALMIFAWTGAFRWVHWIAVCISGFLFGFAMITIYTSANSYIIDSYSNNAASAMAAKTFIRSEVGAMVPLFVTPMFHNMGFQWAGLLLSMFAMAIAPIPFVFFRIGDRVRARSARASKLVRITDDQVARGEKYVV